MSSLTVYLYFLVNLNANYRHEPTQFFREFQYMSNKMQRYTVYTEWPKKRELLKNPTKIEEIQEKKYWQKLNHYELPFKRQ